MNGSFSNIPDTAAELDQHIAEREANYDLKNDSRAQIIWADPHALDKTEYAIVYLHGFRASHPEGNPVHKQVAHKMGYNLFLSRLSEHGIQSDYPLLNLTEEKLIQSAQFAIEIGKRIGKKVILMGTSTGGSLALYWAAQSAYQNDISSLVLYSPLIEFYGINQKLLGNPAMRSVMGMIPGKKYLIKSPETTYAEARIWNKEYALGGTLALGAFIQHHMNKSLFKKIRQPTFIGYYYKDQNQQDTVVSVHAIKQMAKTLGSRTETVHLTNFPNAKNHVICNGLVSKSVTEVVKNTINFLKNVGSHEASENPK